MDLTVIVSYYKALLNLKIILRALNNQSSLNFEVILSEDDSNEETLDFIKEEGHTYNFPIVHLNQREDNGFRKNTMLNKSILKSKGETLAFIDGDCVPHKHFVKEYIKQSETGFILFGRRVKLGERTTSAIKQNEELNISTFSLLFSDSAKLKEGVYWPWFVLAMPLKNRGVLGCNWGIKKKHLLDVNGFDEDYVLAGTGEDTDVEWRLRASGLRMKSMKNKAIVYHLHHPLNRNRDAVLVNFGLLNEKKSIKNIKCLNGLEKLESL